jgi:hypothetical protein
VTCGNIRHDYVDGGRDCRDGGHTGEQPRLVGDVERHSDAFRGWELLPFE